MTLNVIILSQILPNAEHVHGWLKNVFRLISEIYWDVRQNQIGEVRFLEIWPVLLSLRWREIVEITEESVFLLVDDLAPTASEMLNGTLDVSTNLSGAK